MCPCSMRSKASIESCPKNKNEFLALLCLSFHMSVYVTQWKIVHMAGIEVDVPQTYRTMKVKPFDDSVKSMLLFNA